MKRYFASTMFAALLALSTASVASGQNGKVTAQDSDTHINAAKVVEVAPNRIAVIAQSGVEHVIAIRQNSTRISRDGRTSSAVQLNEGDIVTVELDADNPMKVAKSIRMSANTNSTELASLPE
ncbi:MAG: hypothetical protein MSG64_01245 [Pyrinomonadaceae bacterium MAG19_C2-C3]|nr:hypothetical protein [Pyrinomonadaceae bacterium MAG19_C2-C3]